MIKTWKSPHNLALLSIGLACISSAACTYDDDGTPYRMPPIGDSEPNPTLAGTESSFLSIGQQPDPNEDSRPEFLAFRQVDAENLMVGTSTVYWVSGEGEKQQLNSLELTTGENLSLIQLDLRPYASAIHSKSIYLASEGQVVGIKPGEGRQQGILDIISSPLAIAVSDDSVYWVTSSGCLYVGASEGGDSSEIDCVSGMATKLTLSSEFIYWTTTEGILYQTPRSLEGQTTKVSKGDFSAGIVADNSGVYWADGDAREVRHYLRSTGETIVLASGEPSPAGISQDDDYLYFTTDWDGAVKRLFKGGGPVTTLARGHDTPTEIVVFEEYAYWINEGDGSVMRIATQSNQ